MEVTPYIQDVRGHADSLLASLNLQRDLAQFCDCVIRQSSAQLFLAHRCVLAASSPVLASLLASNGTLLELQAPCLSDSVLRLVLDYIYTGDLPPPAARQQYCSLLTAASYLHMDQLQQDLEARQGTDTDDNFTTSSTPVKHCRIMNDQPFSEDVYSEHTAVEIYTSLCENSMGQQDRAFSAQTCDETHTAKRSSCLACNGNNCSSGSDVLLNTTGADDLMGALGRKESGGELCSAATDDPERAPRSTGELGPSRRQCSRAREASQASSSSNGPSVHHHRGGGERSPISFSNGPSVHHHRGGGERSPISFSNGPSVHHHRGGGERSPTSSSPLSCSAVPVICHSGRAAVLQPAETATLPHLCPGPQSSSGAGIPRGAITVPPSPKEGTHSNASGAGFKDVCNRPLAPNQHGNGVGTQSWKYNEQGLDGCGIQNFYFHHRGVRHEDDYSTECGLTLRTDVKDHLVCCESLQCDDDTKHPSDDDALPPNEDYKTDPDAEDYKDSDDEKQRPPVGYFDVSMTTAEALPTGGCRSLIVVGSNIGTCEHQYGDYCLEGKIERERDGNLLRTESRMDHVTCGHLNPSMTHERPERESHTALAGDTSYNPAYSYGGHLQSQEYTQQTPALSYTHPESQYPQHSRHTHPPPDHPNLPGEWGVGVGTRSGRNRSPLTQPWSGVAIKEQLFLLDISTAPARYLLSHEAHGGGEGRAAELQTGDGGVVVVGGALDRGIVAQVHRRRGLDGYSDGRAASPREESSTDSSSSAVTDDGEERGPSTSTRLSSCMPPGLPVYVSSSGPATPSPTTALVSAPPHSAAAAAVGGRGASQTLLLQHPYHCTLCDRSFSQRGSLNRHMRSHLGVRPYPCPRCPMTFSRQYRVTEHMRVHQRSCCGPPPDEELQKPPAPPT